MSDSGNLLHTGRSAATAGVNRRTRKMFCRRVIRCGYCGDLHSAMWARCPVCRSKKVEA